MFSVANFSDLESCINQLSKKQLVKYAWKIFVYKIPYRRAPRLAYRLSASRENTGILHTRQIYSVEKWSTVRENASDYE